MFFAMAEMGRQILAYVRLYMLKYIDHSIIITKADKGVVIHP